MRISLFVGTFVRSFMNRSAGGGSQVNVGGRVFHTLALLAGLCLCSNARAQCPGRWLVDLPGVEARVLALTMWDPDGSGPLSPVLVAGGDFVSTNDINYIAFWDGTTWNPISTGMDGPVMGLFVDSNGDLIAGGHVTTAGGVSANNIAKWNGTTWSALGSGITSPPGSLFCVASPYLPDGVRAIAQFPNGDLVVGGFFDTAGGGTANNIAVWNGTAWSTLASGTNNAVNALAFLQNGDLIVGGQFSSASGVSNTVSIARWTSSTSTPTWQSMGNADKCVLALVVGPTGDLFAAGDFYTIGGVASENLAKFDGTGWSVVGSVPIPPDGHGTSALLILANGDLIAAGNFVTVDGISANNIARWDGSRLTPPSSPSWHTVGSGLSGGDWYYPVFALAQTPAGDLVAGGSFQQAGVHEANGIALWDGTEPSPPTTPDWHRLRFPFNERFNGPVFAFLHLDDGSLIVGGDFTLVGETPINRIARWNGATWSAFGSGMNDAVRALALLPNPSTQEKRLVAGGDFTTAGGSTRNRVALWDGTAWQSMNAGMNSTVRALAYSPMDGLLAGGDFTSAGTHGCLHVAAWTGSNWENPGGLTGTDGPVYALAYNPYDMTTIAGGSFTNADGPLNPAYNIAILDTGNTGMWLPMDVGAYGTVYSIVCRPNGRVIAGGEFYAAGSGPAADTQSLAEFNGTSWASLGGGVGGTVRAMALKPNGDLAIGGYSSFVGTGAGTVYADNVAILSGS